MSFKSLRSPGLPRDLTQAAAAVTNIKTFIGLAIATTKTFNGITVATAFKAWNGLTK